MIEIIIDGKTAREKLFDTYKLSYNGDKYIFPKNVEIRKYCKFLKSYYTNYNKEANYLNSYFVMEIVKEEYEKSPISIIRDDESVLFEFPDDYPEEELFYFKLKYC